jgi:hypothetical protein
MSDKAKALVKHLISAQIDNPDHIHLIAPLTQSYDLLLGAASELFGQPADEIERQFEEQRAKIESYRPLVAEVDKQRDKAERYERALNEIAYDHPESARDVARRALGDS